MQDEKEFRSGSELFLQSVATFAEVAVRGAMEDRDEVKQILHDELEKALDRVEAWDDDKFELEVVRINVFADVIGSVIHSGIVEKMMEEEEEEGELDGNYS